jgi:hypothetical protein
MNLVRFYRGEEADDQGRWLKDYWSWDYDRLEGIHDYIQQMFPLARPVFSTPAHPRWTTRGWQHFAVIP